MRVAQSTQAANSVLTVTRGMQVLRAFRSDRAPMSNAELVRRTGFSKASVSRLTSTLLHLGFIRHVSSTRLFELAAGPLVVGHAFITTSELLQRAHPFMQSLANKLGVSVALAVNDGVDMLYIGYRASQKVATLRLGLGSVLPMGTTSIGHAYLWALPDADRKRQMAELRRNAGSAASVLENAVHQSFAELESTGACVVLGGFQRDAFGVAVPVHVGRQRRIMALSCGLAEVRPDLDRARRRIAPVLKQHAITFEELVADIDGLP